MPKLVAESGQFSGAEYPLSAAPVVLGRLPNNDIQVNDNKASRRHTKLTPQGADWFVEDLQSSNGTFLNGKKLGGPMALRDGDKIAIGTTVYRFVLVGTATGPPPPKVPLAPAATRTVPAPVVQPSRPPAPSPAPARPSVAPPPPKPAAPSPRSPLDASTPPTAQIPLGMAPPAAAPKPPPRPPALAPVPSAARPPPPVAASGPRPAPAVAEPKELRLEEPEELGLDAPTSATVPVAPAAPRAPAAPPKRAPGVAPLAAGERLVSLTPTSGPSRPPGLLLDAIEQRDWRYQALVGLGALILLVLIGAGAYTIFSGMLPEDEAATEKR